MSKGFGLCLSYLTGGSPSYVRWCFDIPNLVSVVLLGAWLLGAACRAWYVVCGA